MFDSTRKIATVGERLSEALTKKGMRQAELCRRTGVHSSSMSLYLSGGYEPKQDKIYKMAKALNVSSEWLMGYDVPMMRLPWEEMSPGETQLTEGEKKLLELFRLIPEEKKQMVLDMIRAALTSK